MKYTVRMEFDIESIDFGDVVIEATSKKEAVKLAIDKYLNSNELDIDYYAADVYDSTLRAEDSNNWKVEEVTDEMVSENN